jgi:hypothetical protein
VVDKRQFGGQFRRFPRCLTANSNLVKYLIGNGIPRRKIVGRTGNMKPKEKSVKFRLGKDTLELFQDRRKLMINGVACRMETDDDGFLNLHGPDEVWVQMRKYEGAHNRLVAVSQAIGVNVNTLDPETLDQMLADRHSIIVEFVPDGSSLDVTPEEYAALVTDHEQFANAATGSDGFRAGMKRSAIIRKHMMAAKIEERIARGLAKKSTAGN